MAKSLPGDYVEVARWMLGQTPVKTAIAIAGLTLALFLAALFVAITFVTMTTDMRELDAGDRDYREDASVRVFCYDAG